MAKHVASRYLPGRRSSAWLKIKPSQVIPCVIIGYRPAKEGFSSLLVAAERQGSLEYVPQLTSASKQEQASNSQPLVNLQCMQRISSLQERWTKSSV